MSDSFPDIKSVVARVITNKPVRKTPYQVKGVFMRQYPDEPIIPMLDGSYRDRYLYPRVQVKILNEAKKDFPDVLFFSYEQTKNKHINFKFYLKSLFLFRCGLAP